MLLASIGPVIEMHFNLIGKKFIIFLQNAQDYGGPKFVSHFTVYMIFNQTILCFNQAFCLHSCQSFLACVLI